MPESGNGSSHSSHTSEAWRAGRKAYDAASYGEAVRLLSKAVAEDGSQAGAWLDLGSARWRRGDRDGAIEAWRRAASEDPTRSRAWHNLSTALLSAGRWREAADAADKAVRVEPSRAKSWNNLAVAREGMADGAGAEAALRRAVDIDPSLGVAWGNLGLALLRRGVPAEAREAFRRAIDGKADDPAYRVGLARATAEGGDAPGAEAYLVAAAKADPSCVELWVALGDVRRGRGDAANALEAYDHAAESATDLPDAVRARVVRRRRVAALVGAGAAAGRGDAAAVATAASRLRQAGQGEAPPPDDDSVIGAALKRCLATAAGRVEVGGPWVETALRDALGWSGPAAGAPPAAGTA